MKIRARSERRRVAAAALLALLFAAAPAGADYYQWRDAQGNLHFGERPPPNAEGVERRGAAAAAQPSEEPEAAGPAASGPQPQDYPPFRFEDPAGSYWIDFPAGWTPFADEVVAEWNKAIGRKLDGAFHYVPAAETYGCPCVMVAPMPDEEHSALTTARYEELPLERGLGAAPVAATGEGEPPVIHYDPAGGHFWFRQEGVAADGVLNTSLVVNRLTRNGGVMLIALQPKQSLEAYTDVVLPVVGSLQSTGGIVAPAYPRIFQYAWAGGGIFTLLLAVVGWRRGGLRRALVFMSAPALSFLAFMLAAAANPSVMQWEFGTRIGHLVGLAVGMPILAFTVALIQKKTRSLEQAMSWYLKALLLGLLVLGFNAVQVAKDRSEAAKTAEQASPAAEPTP